MSLPGRRSLARRRQIRPGKWDNRLILHCRPIPFIDPQNAPLTYNARLASGTALPSWLQFNAATQTFMGTVPNNVVGMSILVTATNTSSLSASETFSVKTPAAAAPTLTNQTGTQTCTSGLVNFTLAADTFTDPNGGTLAYTASLSNGAPLPSWLHFDATTEVFSGVMPEGTKAVAINVTATNKQFMSTSDTFVISMAQVAAQFGQAIAGMTSGPGSTAALTLTLSPQTHNVDLAPSTH